MLNSNDVEKMICRMLDMGDEELLAEMERSFRLSDERHQRISDTLEEMMLEVDRLISRIDEIEDEPLEDEDE
jgi:signal recognition particle GTPase